MDMIDVSSSHWILEFFLLFHPPYFLRRRKSHPQVGRKAEAAGEEAGQRRGIHLQRASDEVSDHSEDREVIIGICIRSLL